MRSRRRGRRGSISYIGKGRNRKMGEGVRVVAFDMLILEGGEMGYEKLPWI